MGEANQCNGKVLEGPVGHFGSSSLVFHTRTFLLSVVVYETFKRNAQFNTENSRDREAGGSTLGCQ